VERSEFLAVLDGAFGLVGPLHRRLLEHGHEGVRPVAERSDPVEVRTRQFDR
jgi:hypothetical protein